MVPKNVFRRQDSKVLSLPPHQVLVPDNDHWGNCDLQVLKTSVVMCSTVPIRFQTYFGFLERPVFGVMPVPPEYAVPHPPVLSVPALFFVWYRSITHPDISVNLPHTTLQVQGMISRNRILRQFPQSYFLSYYTAKAYCRSHKPQYAFAFMKLLCYTILMNHSTVSGE